MEYFQLIFKLSLDVRNVTSPELMVSDELRSKPTNLDEMDDKTVREVCTRLFNIQSRRIDTRVIGEKIIRSGSLSCRLGVENKIYVVPDDELDVPLRSVIGSFRGRYPGETEVKVNAVLTVHPGLSLLELFSVLSCLVVYAFFVWLIYVIFLYECTNYFF